MTRPANEPSKHTLGWLTLGAIAIGGLIGAAVLTRQPATRTAAGTGTDSAPGRTARQTRFGRFAVVGRTVTIHRPRQEVYDRWRDPATLPRVIDHVSGVTDLGNGVFRWDIDGPIGTAHLETEIVSDREGEEIAWRSTEGSLIKTQGKVMFRDAPGDRGTEVEAIIAYTPMLGELGRMVAKLAGVDPETQGRRALKRLKMLMETGEIATSRNRRDPDTDPDTGTAGTKRD
ncbi:MAG: SRPBCC family protein [Pseudotabrizicola sp.]|uniref:SRPBCC family protein n=1 Tax=Pseudotabrizicola sp. TaxID=2939647 RepID=UPI0027203627|nr:SRPBCC family protein [Pseudotabrizicola sp.]MDO9639894.1 SRPBCC family protein [Pseudotabrizicola sp.]